MPGEGGREDGGGPAATLKRFRRARSPAPPAALGGFGGRPDPQGDI